MLAFTYCHLIWMYCSKTANSLINKIHKRSLRVIYEMEDANIEDLLIKDSSNGRKQYSHIVNRDL